MGLSGVGKRYGRGGRWILRDVDLEPAPGQLLRIEGANGSGKSTLLKLVAGIERPSAGRVEVPGRRAYVPERFPPALPFDAHTYLVRLGRVHGLPAPEARRRAGHWLDRFGIADRAGTPLRHLSKGTCQKVAVAQALLAEADVLLLDEAWTGLDGPGRARPDGAGRGGGRARGPGRRRPVRRPRPGQARRPYHRRVPGGGGRRAAAGGPRPGGRPPCGD